MCYSRALLIVFVVILNLSLKYAESRSSLTSTEKKPASVIDAKRKEIESLRAELNQAFEVHDEKLLSNEGIVVQPKWLQGGEKPTAANSKVVVTKKGLEEVKALRQEIQKAVAEDVYVASVAATSAGDTKNLKQLHADLNAKQEAKAELDTLVTATDNRDSDNADDAEVVGSLQDDNIDFEKAGPNTVDANAIVESDIDLRKLQRLEVSKRRTKEVLILKSIEEDFSFNLGEDVHEWAHIMHGGEEYFIGRRVVDLLIVRKNAAKYEQNMILEVGEPITYLETYSYWNLEQQHQEGVIIVASLDKVLWYRINKDTLFLELNWEWVIGSKISGLTHFNVETKNYLAISTNAKTNETASVLNIYQFKLNSKEFWIAQHLPMAHPCREVTFLDTGRDLILATAQNHTAAIYSFNPNVPAYNHLYFQHLRSIASEDIERIAAFKMGGHSYLAIGGRSPQILLYYQGDFISKTLLGQNFGLVELFFPIPIRTYRDDLILLVQHSVDFSTHALTVLETLIWDGNVFQSSIPVPCQLGQHTVYGVSCMLDLHRDEGLKGASLLRRGNEISVIVPRHKAESGLFRLHTELLSKNSDLLDLQEIFAFLKDWVKEQDDLITQAQAFLAMPNDQKPQITKMDLSNLESLKTPELYFSGQVGQIYVNDYRWTEQDTNTDLEFVIETIQQLEDELRTSRQRRDVSQHPLTFDSLDFATVEVVNLEVNKVNNVRFYIQNANLEFNGLLNVSNLEIIDEIMDRTEGHSLPKALVLNQDIEVDEINGIVWQDLMDNLLLRNKPFEIEELEIDGELIVEDELTIMQLNSLKFPHDLLWSSGPATSIVKSEKVFTGTLSANVVDTEGIINGVNPTDAITLTDAQDWTGFPTFAQLEVTEKFELNGTAQGRGLRNFPRNPTLEEANVLQASCLFELLEVNGPIFMKGQFDKGLLSTLLKNIVQRTADPAEKLIIDGQKTFNYVELPIDFNVENSHVNNIDIQEFIPKHSSQQLIITVLPGYVYFNNLSLTGNYDDVNITELLQNAIKINDTQLSPKTQLNFVDVMQAKSIELQETLSGVPLSEGFQTIDKHLQMKIARFEYLQANTASIPNDIEGSGTLNDLNLRDFLSRQNTSKSVNTGNIFLNELILEDSLQTNELHGIDAMLLFDFLADIDDLPDKILDGTVQVDHVIVTGDVQLNKLNEQHFDEHIQLTAIWLNRPNYLSTYLKFKEKLTLQSDLTVLGEFNGENLVDLIENIVFRNEDNNTIIFSPKSFLKDVVVIGQTKVDAINGIPFNAIANKQTSLILNCTLQINGKLHVPELDVKQYINEYSMHNVNQLLRYDPEHQAFIMLGDISVSNPQYLQDLTVFGDLQKLRNITDFFDNILYKQQMCMLEGKNTFTGRVSIEKGAYIRSLNGYNLLALLNNIVFKDELGPVLIKSPVTFMSKVYVQDLTIKSELNANNLNDCMLHEWLNDTLNVNQSLSITKPLTFAKWTLNDNHLNVKSLNDVRADRLITLHTTQNLTNKVNFSELFLDGTIDTSGFVNGVDIEKEYHNTLLTFGDQHIVTPLSMASIEVLKNLKINTLVNSDKNFSDIATLHETSLHLESPLFFQNLTTDNLYTSDELSGINFNEWFDKTLWLHAREQQWITSNWSVKNLMVKEQAPMPLATLNYEEFDRNSRATKKYKTLCYKVKKLEESMYQQNTKHIKQIDQSFIMDLSKRLKSNIRKGFALTNAVKTENILVNMGCNSHLYQWHAANKSFSLLSELVTGPIDEVFVLPRSSVKNTSSLQFVTSFESTDNTDCELDNWPTARATQAAQSNNYKLIIFNNRTFSVQQLDDKSSEKFWKQSAAFLRSHTRAKRLTINKYSLPLFYRRSSKQLNMQSKVKPNVHMTTTYTFDDFRIVLGSILADLNYRLNLEINITQLSIPESDLYDAHLMQDFISIMDELEKQKLYPLETFEKVSKDSLQLPANPAQVLAARTVQIIWPVIIEIEEIHKHVIANHTNHQHPMCLHLSNNLAWTVRDVLILANFNGNRAKNKDYTHELSAVIERIRALQNEIEAMHLSTIVAHEHKSPNTTSTMQLDVYFANAQEFHALKVGSTNLEHSLIAVLTANESNRHDDAVHLFHDIQNGKLFQTIKTSRPHSLTSLRIHNETLLAFIEDQHTVNILTYRGIQGFIEFAKFKVKNEAINLFNISLPQNDGSLKHYFVAVHAKKLVFYEIILAGSRHFNKSSILCF